MSQDSDEDAKLDKLLAELEGETSEELPIIDKQVQKAKDENEAEEKLHEHKQIDIKEDYDKDEPDKEWD